MIILIIIMYYQLLLLFLYDQVRDIKATCLWAKLACCPQSCKALSAASKTVWPVSALFDQVCWTVLSPHLRECM